MYLNRRHARTHFSDNSVIRDVMMETCDLCISVLRAGASRLHVSHVVVGTERIWRIPHRWGVLRLSPASSVSRRRAVRDGGAISVERAGLPFGAVAPSMEEAAHHRLVRLSILGASSVWHVRVVTSTMVGAGCTASSASPLAEVRHLFQSDGGHGRHW
jgi:hypothetical protein